MFETLRSASIAEPLIMVIEDDSDSAMLLEELLQDAHLRTIWHRDGAQALRALDARAEVPSLILLDLHMPTMDGWTFRVEQRRRGYLQDVPVAVISADGSSQARAIDADLFLPKPLEPQRLVTAVQETLMAVERRRMMATSFELERLRALGVLLGTVVHELNGPLQYIIGFLEVAHRACTPLGNVAASTRQAIEAAQKASEGMREIVSDLRVFSRTESEQGVADVVQALQAAIRLNEPAMRGRASLKKSWPAVLPKVVGNEGRLSQVFLNLLSNATQAIQEGKPQVNAVTVAVVQKAGCVVVEVSDTGEGMTPEVLVRAFDPFFTTKGAADGTGIGLSFCRHVVESYGGSISAHSELGKGSTLCVELPLAQEEASAPQR